MEVKIGCEQLKGTDAKGKLVPDEDGYYTTVLGAYGMKNENGVLYERSSVEKLVRTGVATFSRLLKKGRLFAEIGHPDINKFITIDSVTGKKKLDEDAYFRRLRKLEVRNQACHIRNVTFKDMVNDKGEPILAVIGEVRPQGEYNDTIRQELENPYSNSHFSVRSFVDHDSIRLVRMTLDIITWDHVPEGGIHFAQKMRSPALENFEEINITPAMILNAQEIERGMSKNGNESLVSSLENIANAVFGRKRRISPTYTRW